MYIWMPSSSDESSKERHWYLLQNQPIRVLGNDSWTPFPVCTGGEINKYSALIITASFTGEQEITHYSYSFIVHIQRRKNVSYKWCDKTNYQKATILALVESTNTDKSVGKSPVFLQCVNMEIWTIIFIESCVMWKFALSGHLWFP